MPGKTQHGQAQPGQPHFEQDEAFLQSGYNAEQHLGNTLILRMVQAVSAKSAPAYHMAKAFSYVNGKKFFDSAIPVFPLRPFVSEEGYGDVYIKKLARGDEAACEDYVKESGKRNRTASKKKTAGKLSQIKGRYKATSLDEKVREGVFDYDWKFLRYAMEKNVKDGEVQRKGRQRDLVHNIDNLSGHLGLDEADQTIFKYLVAYQNSPQFKTWVDDVSDKKDAQMALMAMAAGVSVDEVRKRISPDGALYGKGLIKKDDAEEEEEEADASAWLPEISKNVQEVLQSGNGSESDYIRKICGDPQKPEYSLKDFPHLGEEIGYAVKLLRDAVKNKERGVNVFILGEKGVGKTALATALGKKAAARFYRPCEHQKLSERGDLLTALNAAQAMVAGSGNTILGFENMEILCETSDDENNNKTAQNDLLDRMLQNNEAPMIWTIEDLKALGPLASRITWLIHVPQPPPDVRTKMYLDSAKRMGRKMEKEDAEYLGQLYTASPAIIHKAMKSEASLSDAESDRVNRDNVSAILDNTSRAMYGMKTSFQRNLIAEPYDLSLANASIMDLDWTVEKAIQNAKDTKEEVQLIIYGVPGTGKTALAHYFAAEVLEKEVLEKDFAALSSKWHGESEKKMADAFKEARYLNRMLLINEADSILSRRTQNISESNPSNTVTNQVLTLMEKADISVAMTTNFVEAIDTAAARRFVLQIRLDPLRPDQFGACYEKFFGREMPKNNKLGNAKLAVGDFASVKKMLKLFKDNMTDDELQHSLLSKLKMRQGNHTVIEGFNQHRWKI